MKPVAPSDQKMMLGKHGQGAEKLVGMDLFIETEQLAHDLASTIQSILPASLKLVNIANRGTQVWPVGSKFTECVDQYTARIEAISGTSSMSELLACSQALSSTLNLSSIEFLKYFDNKAGYTLAQGQ
jgi:isocitrate dehydrogenase